jgi:uncharacterized membrane protein
VGQFHGSWWTTALVAALLLSQAVWVGGLVVIYVVARVARRTLSSQQQAEFFRALGRTYAPVGGAALALCLATGSVLARDQAWRGRMVVAAVLAAALVVVTTLGVVQARAMSRLRHAAIEAPDGTCRIEPYARRASSLRGLIALLTLALVCVASTMLG